MADDNSRPCQVCDTCVAGAASLSLTEAMLLMLLDKGVISDMDYDEAFEAAINAHRETAIGVGSALNHKTAKLLNTLRVEGNSVRWTSSANNESKRESAPDGQD